MNHKANKLNAKVRRVSNFYRFFKGTSAASAIEYSLLIAGITVAITFVTTVLGR